MVFFRADSNNQIASGHIMRCISIAQAFKDMGQKVVFLVADDNPVEMLERAKMEYLILNSVWNQLTDEIETMKSILLKEEKPFLIVDTYQVSQYYVDELSSYANICYLGSKKEYLGKLKALINYSTDIDFEFYSSNYGKDTKLLLGASYAPLRKEFLEITHRKSKNGRCRILLTTGNTDPNGYVDRILNQIVSIDCFEQMEVKVVVGRMFDNKHVLHDHFDSFENITLHENVVSMSTLMSESDLAVSANGTTVYELAAAKVPTISFAMVEEQVKSARKLSELGVVDYCGELYKNEIICIEEIIKKIINYVSKPQDREALAHNANSIIDGRGCERIVKSLL